ncbi:MAG TPA: hypothetical protein VI727_04355 [Candidatus Brocadiaceae bacterium]|nr:hypothetical protein [Candidatus Brocadiaceae bacterium]
MAKQIEIKKENLVLGRVVDRLNRPLANLIVQAYDRDMRSEELLGKCSDNTVFETIKYGRSQL